MGVVVRKVSFIGTSVPPTTQGAVMNTTDLNELAIRNGSARARKLRSLAIIDITRRLYDLPLKATYALAERLDRRAAKLKAECATC